MNKIAIAAVLMISALVFTNTAVARIGAGVDRGTLFGYCMMTNSGDNGGNLQNLEKYQKDTLSLWDTLFNTRAELANEYSKPTLDTALIIELQRQIASIRVKIQEAAVKYGLPAGGLILDPGCRYYKGSPA
jgi:hypothetical protein